MADRELMPIEWLRHLKQCTAERERDIWVRDFGAMSAAQIVLVDTTDGRVIHRWPDET